MNNTDDKESRTHLSTVKVLTEEEAERNYEELISQIDNLDEFKQAAQRYELELDERIIYEKIIDLEFLLGYDMNTEC